jgi:hypothetical protein
MVTLLDFLASQEETGRRLRLVVAAVVFAAPVLGAALGMGLAIAGV